MEKLAKQKGLFIGLSCLSVGCLVSSWGYPLQQLEIYSQQEIGKFGYSYDKRFIITESDQNYPYGFNRDRAVKIAQVYQSYAPQKIMLLILAGICAGYARFIGENTVTNSEIDDEVKLIKDTGRKQLLLEKIKHELALRSKAQKLLFIEEMKAMLEEFGTPEQELLEADEINALYDEVNDSSEESATQSQEQLLEEIRKVFPENLDATCWKAVSKAITDGRGREEILTEVLESNNDIGGKYLDFLKSKYL